VPTPPDSIQAFNAFFIVLLVPVSVAFFKLVPVKATTKIALGYVLTGLSMVIMSLAGFQAGQAQKSVKLTFAEGALVLPASTRDLAEVTSGAVDFGGVQVNANEWIYDKNKNKLTFKDGTIRLADGKEIKILEGHGDWPLSDADTIAAGVLEPLLMRGDDLEDVKKDATTVTLGVVDWVEPAERITVWWQVFAYLILTVAEILVSITGLELAFVAAPATMKSFVTACWLAIVFLANLLINAPIAQLYPLMSPGVYFAMLAGFVAVVLAVYAPIARRFNRNRNPA